MSYWFKNENNILKLVALCASRILPLCAHDSALLLLLKQSRVFPLYPASIWDYVQSSFVNFVTVKVESYSLILLFIFFYESGLGPEEPLDISQPEASKSVEDDYSWREVVLSGIERRINMKVRNY